MALTSRRRRPLDRKVEHFRDTKLIVIAVEGEKTERQYFDLFRNVRVQIRVLATGKDHASSPEHVLARLADFRAEHDFESDDEFWFMVDVDRWGSEKLDRVTSIAIQKDYNLAISNPCFECWLYLHLDDPPKDWRRCHDFKHGIRNRLGSYNSSKLDISQFGHGVRSALLRSKALDTQPAERWPNSVGSHVYRVVEKVWKV